MIRFRQFFPIVFSFFMAVIGVANADTLSGGTGAWWSWGVSTVRDAGNNPVYGGPFWNNASADGLGYGIGWCLTGLGACSIANPPGSLPYYADASGAALSNLSFTSASTPVSVTLRGVFTNQSTIANGIDYIGYYLLDSSGHVISATRLLSAGDPLGTTVSFSLPAGATYGFYLENVQGEGTVNETDYWLYMDSTQDTTNRGIVLDTLQHTAVFSESAGLNYYLGFEDTTHGVGDFDYNDVIVEVTAVPEPASSALTIAGLAGLGFLFRRSRVNGRARQNGERTGRLMSVVRVKKRTGCLVPVVRVKVTGHATKPINEQT